MKPNARGLTLIELTISSLIFTVLMVTVYSAFHSGVFGHRNIEKSLDIYQASRQVLERMNLDLRNSFSYSRTKDKENSMFTGDPDRLQFLTLVDSYLEGIPVQDYAFVAYRLEAGKIMRLCRKNKESLKSDSAVEPEEMSGQVKDLVFSYGAVNTDTQAVEFQDEWSDTKTLPQFVKVKLSIENKETKTEEEFERTIFLPQAQ